jgi:hypothetical protein
MPMRSESRSRTTPMTVGVREALTRLAYKRSALNDGSKAKASFGSYRRLIACYMPLLRADSLPATMK